MSEADAKLRRIVREAIGSGEVEMVIGFAAASRPGRVTPVFCRTAEEAERLVAVAKEQGPNLAGYLVRPELAGLKCVAVVARHVEAKAAVGLVQESQIEADRVRLVMVTAGAGGEAEIGEGSVTIEQYLAASAGRRGDETAAERFAEVDALDAKPVGERWDYWAQELDRCIRCYACRNVCPLCYCERCIADKNQPQWIETSATPRGNFAWNLVRAFHLAGRCIDCGACERACPMDIPLMALNRKMKRVVAERFDYVAGFDTEADPPLSTFSKDDEEEFIR